MCTLICSQLYKAYRWRCRHIHRHRTPLSGLSHGMSLFDLKCLESGQYVVWTLWYDHAARDEDSTLLASERLSKELNHPVMLRTTIWHNTESGIQAVKDILSKEVLRFDSSSKLTMRKKFVCLTAVAFIPIPVRFGHCNAWRPALGIWRRIQAHRLY